MIMRSEVKEVELPATLYLDEGVFSKEDLGVMKSGGVLLIRCGQRGTLRYAFDEESEPSIFESFTQDGYVQAVSIHIG